MQKSHIGNMFHRITPWKFPQAIRRLSKTKILVTKNFHQKKPQRRQKGLNKKVKHYFNIPFKERKNKKTTHSGNTEKSAVSFFSEDQIGTCLPKPDRVSKSIKTSSIIPARFIFKSTHLNRPKLFQKEEDCSPSLSLST